MRSNITKAAQIFIWIINQQKLAFAIMKNTLHMADSKGFEFEMIKEFSYLVVIISNIENKCQEIQGKVLKGSQKCGF